MKKLIIFLLTAALVLSSFPAFAAENDEIKVSAERAMYFDNNGSLQTTDGDNLLIAAGGTWTAKDSFTDEDGTVTKQPSLSGDNFKYPRHTVIAFKLPDIDYSCLIGARLSMTVKNVKQSSGGQRIGVYANSIKEEWSADQRGKELLGSDGLASLEMIGFTGAIKAGDGKSEVPSDETVTLSTKRLVSYLKELKSEGYSEVTFRLANSNGGIRIYDLNQPKAPSLTLVTGDNTESYGLTGSVIDEEGAQCWFGDPRSLTYKNGDINKTYVGYIDVHGSIKAMQYDNNTKEYEEVLVRSNFQPDDHNNPTFLALPDGRIMIFYSRHTDEACFYYRVSRTPGDITTLGEEKYLKTANNTTYPNPFILSDDPEHIYLCWRGIGWHPTIAQLSIPDENGDTSFTWGPRQIVKSTAQSSNCRPYAKYASNGKDKIMISYTATHPDNVGTNPLYFNYISVPDMVLRDIHGNAICDLKGNSLHTVTGGEGETNFSVIDRTGNVRDWLWEVAVCSDGNPAVAMVKIDGSKKKHSYYYVKYNGEKWIKTLLPCEAGNTTMHNSPTEYCYSGGMSFDKADPRIIYASMPVEGAFGQVWEIVKFTMNEDGSAIEKTEYITKDSKENNVRPFVSPGSCEGDLRLTWMNGYYQYWMVKTSYPDGYPTRMMTSTELKTPETVNELEKSDGKVYRIDGQTEETSAPKGKEFTISLELLQSDMNKGGTLIESGNCKVELEKQTVDPKKDYKAVAPKITVGEKSVKSDNLFSNSDWFAKSVKGTNGDKGVNNMGWVNYTVTYDGNELLTYVNGLIDASVQNADVTLGEKLIIGGIDGIIANVRTADKALTQAEIRKAEKEFDGGDIEAIDTVTIKNADNVTKDLILPKTAYDGSVITWTSEDESVITSSGAVVRDESEHIVKITASVNGKTKDFEVTVKPKTSYRDNLILKYDFSGSYEKDGKHYVKDSSGMGHDGELMGSAKADGKLDLRRNTGDGFETNGYVNVPYDILNGVRSYTVAQRVAPGTSAAPRLYDFGSGSSHSVFTRADSLAAGIKNGDTQYETASKAPAEGKEQWVITVYSAATGETAIYLDGEKVMSTTKVSHEPYMVSGSTNRNYIGRAQWWDTSEAKNNQDFDGTIDDFMFFNAALSESEIKELMNNESSAVVFEFDGEKASVKGAEDGFVIYIAQYDTEGKLIAAQSSKEKELVIKKNEKTAYIKAFLWKDGTMEPLN